jgi:hypothetical protein
MSRLSANTTTSAPTFQGSVPCAPVTLNTATNNKGEIIMENEIVAAQYGLMELARELSKANMVPANFKRPEDCLFALMMGSEMGLKPIYSLNNIAVINGKPSLMSDALLAVCKANPEYGGMTISETPDSCTVTMKRNYSSGIQDTRTVTFTLADARRAGLVKPGSNWEKYPARMLKARAQAFTCRDLFNDVLAGIYTPEEITDGKIETPPTMSNYEIVDDNPIPPDTPTKQNDPAPNPPKNETQGPANETPATANPAESAGAVNQDLTEARNECLKTFRECYDKGVNGYKDPEHGKTWAFEDVEHYLCVKNIKDCNDPDLLRNFTTLLTDKINSDLPFEHGLEPKTTTKTIYLVAQIEQEIKSRIITGNTKYSYEDQAAKAAAVENVTALEAILAAVRAYPFKKAALPEDIVALHKSISEKHKIMVDQNIDDFHVSKRFTNSVMDNLGTKTVAACNDKARLTAYTLHLQDKINAVDNRQEIPA